MRQIALTRGAVAVLDDEDYELVSQFNWHLLDGKGKRYASNGARKNTISMHRFIMGSPEGMEIDHKDGDGLNNTRANLRICSRGDNVRNRPHKNTTTGYRGVGIMPMKSGKHRWVANITFNTKHIYLGAFDDAISAAKTYDIAAKMYHGEFAYLNFPQTETA